MSTTETERSAARQRLLAAADELFYREGVRTVGIDWVIEHAGVAKATLYKAFGSKEELIRAYLSRRLARRQERVSAFLARHDDPREKILAVFDSQAEVFDRPDFRGCAFINASAEAPPGSAAEDVATEIRRWTRGLFRGLAAQAGAARPDDLARQLHLVYDGASVGAQLDHDPGTATFARDAAAALLTAALGRA
jgi:AcrR family transcriptional regulator